MSFSPVRISDTAPDSLYFNVQDDRSKLSRFRYLIQSCFYQVGCSYRLMKRLFIKPSKPFMRYINPAYSKSEGKYRYDLSKIQWNSDSEGLCLYVHGFRGSSRTWHKYLKYMGKNHPKIDCLAPSVPMTGNCSLEDAADPILAIVEDYLKKHPGRPVRFVGTSNGGRILAYIETELDPERLKNSNLSFVSISGVYSGTKIVNLLKRTRLLFAFF